MRPNNRFVTVGYGRSSELSGKGKIMRALLTGSGQICGWSSGMRRRIGLLASCAFAVLLMGTAASAERLRPGIIGKDDRIRVYAEGTPWDAIGQVNIGGYRRTGKCTGTLIAPDKVVTAAHCIVHPLRGKPFALHNIHFLAGVRRDERKGHATAKCLHLLADSGLSRTGAASARKRSALERLRTDVAIITLKHALPVAPVPLPEDFHDGAKQMLLHAAYPADQRYMLAAHRDCRVRREAGGGSLWFVDCDTHPASSGGPIFAEVDGKLTLMAIMVAAGRGGANFAVPFPQWKRLAEMQSCP